MEKRMNGKMPWQSRIGKARQLFWCFYCPATVFKCQPDSAALTVPPVSCPAAGDSIMSFLFLSSPDWSVQEKRMKGMAAMRCQTTTTEETGQTKKQEPVKHAKNIPVKTARYRNAWQRWTTTMHRSAYNTDKITKTKKCIKKRFPKSVQF